jgi:hypothetical protein
MHVSAYKSDLSARQLFTQPGQVLWPAVFVSDVIHAVTEFMVRLFTQPGQVLWPAVLQHRIAFN